MPGPLVVDGMAARAHRETEDVTVEVWRWSAFETVAALRAGEVGPLDLVDVAAARIAEVDPLVNALPTLCLERARDHARRLETVAPAARGPLAGLPVVIKDLVEVQGVRTTHGSPVFAANVPTWSDYPVERIEAAGGIVLGKSNTPEFGAGANTFNEVFGATRNPWDTRLTCGGSSGGSAVALATGMAWLADGSDLGGSLRTPAAYCSVVGLRPSPGLVAQGPQADPFQTLAVEGPMARDVRDLGLLLDVMAGHDERDPLTWPITEPGFAAAAARPRLPTRVAVSVDLGGVTPVDARIERVFRAAIDQIATTGLEIVETSPDFGPVVETFTTLRALHFVTNLEPLLHQHRAAMKPEVVWNIERGLELRAADIGAALRERGLLQRRVASFLAEHDVLLCPTTIVPPFPVEQRYVETVGEHRFASYIDWLTIVYAITLSGCPALSLPCGFTADGLPVGMQVVGRPRGEAHLLSTAAALEEVLGVSGRVPITPSRRRVDGPSIGSTTEPRCR